MRGWLSILSESPLRIITKMSKVPNRGTNVRLANEVKEETIGAMGF